MPVVVSPGLLNLNEVTCLVATLSLVNALWLATRRIMSNGAMTCRQIRQQFSEMVVDWEYKKGTDLSLDEDG